MEEEIHYLTGQKITEREGEGKGFLGSPVAWPGISFSGMTEEIATLRSQ
jgi:hypothetical protein